ncbi:MAG: peptide/nickel transport system permease protein [Spirochaetes bacterium]|nr:MAG: peptide/nickel transport system permease protein [Spirochaetota bacterium]
MGTQVEATPEQMEELKRLFGEDKPIPVLYIEWLGRVVQGDFGFSLRTSRPILPDILQRLPLSIEITLFALVLALALGIPLGIAAALKQNPLTDIVIRITGLLGLSLPQFWLASLMVIAFSGVQGWIPMGNYISFAADPIKNLKMLFFPSLAIGTGLAAVIMRYTRNSMLEVMQQDYVRTAKAKGLKKRVVVIRHALRNAILPVITVAGFNTGYLLGGAIVIEEVFALPGMGRLALYAIYQRDYPVIQGIVLLIAAMFVLVNLVTDLIYAAVDPRIRLDEGGR